eukprot:c3810_g1_i1.p1 GENE.c3810_g1_i1~~c3810_g1_i1.p1  ORF type:complete len:217 (-),score=42.91 c3810_g1_i1:167-733(-)
MKERDGALIGWMASEDSPIILVKGVTSVRTDAARAFSFVATTNTEEATSAMRIQDPTCIETRQEMIEGEAWTMARYNFGIPGFSHRVFYWKEKRVEEDGVLYNIVTPIPEWEKYPLPPGCVQGELLVAGFIARPTGESTCELTFIVQANPKGWIPTAIVNLTATDQAKAVVRIRRYFEEQEGQTGDDQ